MEKNLLNQEKKKTKMDPNICDEDGISSHRGEMWIVQLLMLGQLNSQSEEKTESILSLVPVNQKVWKTELFKKEATTKS